MINTAGNMVVVNQTGQSITTYAPENWDGDNAFDGSLSGALLEEGKSWGKVGERANAVTIHGDAVVYFPLLSVGVEASV